MPYQYYLVAAHVITYASAFKLHAGKEKQSWYSGQNEKTDNKEYEVLDLSHTTVKDSLIINDKGNQKQWLGSVSAAKLTSDQHLAIR